MATHYSCPSFGLPSSKKGIQVYRKENDKPIKPPSTKSKRPPMAVNLNLVSSPSDPVEQLFGSLEISPPNLEFLKQMGNHYNNFKTCHTLLKDL